MQKNLSKKLLNGLFLLAVFTLTLWAVFRGEDLPEVLLSLKTAKPSYVFAGVMCVLFYILGDALSICYLMRKHSFHISFFRCCLYAFIGFFYCCITPSASGGQPMQILAMRKDGIPAACSTVVLAIITIVYKLVLVLIGTAVLVFRPSQLMVYLESVEALIYLGLVLNIGCVAVLLLFVFHPSLVRYLVEKCFTLLNRIHPLKRMEKRRNQLDRILTQYHGSAAFYRNNKHVILHIFLLTFFQRFLLFLVTWFTYRAFSLSGTSLPIVVSLQAMISVVADMLPLPGGMGISETLFLEIFPTIFGQTYLLPGMMVSRGISYYTQLLISAVMTLAAQIIIKKKPPVIKGS